MRQMMLVAVLTLAAAGLRAAPAGPPITGTISCEMEGTLGLNHPLTNTPSAKAIKVKGTATASSCSGAFTGGKGPIVAATIKVSGKLPAGSSCLTLVTPTFGPTKIQVKFQYKNPVGKLATDAVDNTTLATASFNVGTGTLQVVTVPITKGAFVGQTLTLNVGLDDSEATLLGECGGTGISSLAFGSVNDATVTSP